MHWFHFSVARVPIWPGVKSWLWSVRECHGRKPKRVKQQGVNFGHSFSVFFSSFFEGVLQQKTGNRSWRALVLRGICSSWMLYQFGVRCTNDQIVHLRFIKYEAFIFCEIGSQTSRSQDPSYPLNGWSKRSSLRNPTFWNRLPNVIVSKFLPCFGFLLSAAWKTIHMATVILIWDQLLMICWSSKFFVEALTSFSYSLAQLRLSFQLLRNVFLPNYFNLQPITTILKYIPKNEAAKWHEKHKSLSDILSTSG